MINTSPKYFILKMQLNAFTMELSKLSSLEKIKIFDSHRRISPKSEFSSNLHRKCIDLILFVSNHFPIASYSMSYTLLACFSPQIDFCNLQYLDVPSSNSFGCSMQISSPSFIFQKAVTVTSCLTFISSWAAIASSIRIDVYVTTGAKASSLSIPSACEKPLPPTQPYI